MKAYKPLFPLFLLALAACQGNLDKHHFNGEVVTHAITPDRTALRGEELLFDSLTSTEFALHDSLIIFQHFVLQTYHVTVFNVNTQQYLGRFVHMGRGKNETHGFSQLYPYREGKELKAFAYGGVEAKCYVWNVTQSLQQQTTLYDRVIDYDCREEQPDGFEFMVPIGHDSLLALVPTRTAMFLHGNIDYQDDGSIRTTPDTRMEVNRLQNAHYQYRTLATNQRLDTFAVFKNHESLDMDNPNKDFKVSVALKPDQSKLVEAMLTLPQINIIDLKSGSIKGFRIAGLDDFSVYYLGVDEFTWYHRSVEVTDEHIFVQWINVKAGEYDDAHFYTIHVYDWEGNMVKVLDLEYPAITFKVDAAAHTLYGVHPISEQLYRYELKEAGL